MGVEEEAVEDEVVATDAEKAGWTRHWSLGDVNRSGLQAWIALERIVTGVGEGGERYFGEVVGLLSRGRGPEAMGWNIEYEDTWTNSARGVFGTPKTAATGVPAAKTGGAQAPLSRDRSKRKFNLSGEDEKVDRRLLGQPNEIAERGSTNTGR